MDHQAFKAEVRSQVERLLRRTLDACPESEVRRVAEYIALGGGHRWRALVAVAAGQIFHEDALAICLPGAAGIELAHAASLVLDDLPSMDDGQQRRGKPTAHRVFPQWAVDMAPVFLVTLSYEMSLNNPNAPSERRVAAAIDLSRAGQAMIAGQAADVLSGDVDHAGGAASWDEQQVLTRYQLKSGALYAAAAKAGAMLCGAAADDVDRLYAAGMSLGLSYQYLDDVADAVADPDAVGKDIGVDDGKPTAVSLFGVEGARSRSTQFQEEALAHLEPYGPEAACLRSLVMQASWAPA